MRLNSITPLILTYNEIANIERTITPLGWARRIVVVDSFSDDGTVELLKRDSRVDVYQREFDTFAAQCNFGLEQITTDWVLSLDADYVCSKELIREIENLPDDPAEVGFRVRFRYCVNGRPLRSSLYPPRTILYRRSLARYERDGHAHRVAVGGAQGRLGAFVYHDDRKPLEAWLAAQARYVANEVQKLRTTPVERLSFADRVRLRRWVAPLVMPFYCLLGKALLLDGRAGLEYTLQRTYAELLLSLKLVVEGSSVSVARNEHCNATLESDTP